MMYDEEPKWTTWSKSSGEEVSVNKPPKI